MKRLIIIVEGNTEEEFVNTMLAPEFRPKGIFIIDCFKIKHTKGGLTKYSHLKKDILNALYESNSIVTTLIDYYGLPNDFPGYEQYQNISDKLDRITYLEESIKTEIENSQGRIFDNLMPYIQLHEFEALIFSSKEAIPSLFSKEEFDETKLNQVYHAFSNPEDINNSPQTAPSKRIQKIIPGYRKIVHGMQIIEETGLEEIRTHCTRFYNWLSRIEKRMLR